MALRNASEFRHVPHIDLNFVDCRKNIRLCCAKEEAKNFETIGLLVFFNSCGSQLSSFLPFQSANAMQRLCGQLLDLQQFLPWMLLDCNLTLPSTHFVDLPQQIVSLPSFDTEVSSQEFLEPSTRGMFACGVLTSLVYASSSCFRCTTVEFELVKQSNANSNF